jgi:hypothetical protein
MRECTNLGETPIEELVQESVVYIRQMMPSLSAVCLLGVFGNSRLACQTCMHSAYSNSTERRTYN